MSNSVGILRYILHRLALAVPTLFGVSIIGFAITKMTPGNPLVSVLGFGGSNESTAARALAAELGIGKPLYIQYFLYVWRIIHGNFGISIAEQVPVLTLFEQALPHTLYLIGVSITFALLIGLPIGIFSALRQNTIDDHIARIMSILMASLPDYWVGLLLLIGFAFYIRLFPLGGDKGPDSVVLPALALSFGLAGLIIRLMRSTVITQLKQNYIKTARAKGLKEFAIVRRHLFRNAISPVVTVVGLQVGYLLAGDFFVEYVFAWPGIGRLVVNAILVKDYPVVEAFLLLAGVFYVLINLIVDLIQVVIDPRITFGAGE